MAKPPKDPLLCSDCQERPPDYDPHARWPSKRCLECYVAFAAKREDNRVAKARRFRDAMNAAGPTPAFASTPPAPSRIPTSAIVVEPIVEVAACHNVEGDHTPEERAACAARIARP